MEQVQIPVFSDPLPVPIPLLKEKPRQGVPGKNPAPHPGHDLHKSTVTIGLRAALHLDAVRSRYTGKERDSESGNDYFEARYYSSAMGRFLSPDWSAKEEPVPYAKLDNPQSLNLYAYVLNNPLSRVDADGHDDKTPEKIVAAAKASEGSQSYDINRPNVSNGQFFKPGTDKCNEYVSDTVKNADGVRPVNMDTGKIPTAAQFADPNVKIQGLSDPKPLSEAKPGDVIAQDHGANPKSGNEEGHAGIVVAVPHDGQPGQTASANANQGGKVTVNDWGFRSPTANPNNGERNGAASPPPVVRHPL
jgi:RHS repeat-associated protein